VTAANDRKRPDRFDPMSGQLSRSEEIRVYKKRFSLFACLALGLIGASPPVLTAPFEHHLVIGETFEYERMFTYELQGRTAKAVAHITLDVLRADGWGAKVKQTIAVVGGKTTHRDILVTADGRWTYPDQNLVAQNFAGYDVAQFGVPPSGVRAGSTWSVDVPTTAMFHAGRATVKVLSLSNDTAMLESTGRSSPSRDAVMDSDAHKALAVSTYVNWKMTTTLQDGILTAYERHDTQHIRVAKSFNDQHEYGASLKLIAHHIR
jgi:hypothetical protein